MRWLTNRLSALTDRRGRPVTLPRELGNKDSVLVSKDPSNAKSNKMKIVTDEPSLDGVLDFNKYSQRLADIIVNSTPRFCVGIFGEWGTGKTTLMKMIERNLQNHDDILVVWFDAWKYEKEKHLAVLPFIRTVEIELENRLVQQLRGVNNFNSKLDTERWNKVRKQFEKTFNAFIESTSLNLGVSAGAEAAGEINLAKFRDVLKSDGHPIRIDNENIFYHHKHITQYLEDGLHKLRDPEHGGNDNYRIVIFIDDLDRCSPDKALELIESLKTFFDIEGFVYVIGMDSNSIDHIIKQKYGEDSNIKGTDYLKKFVQLPFQIPAWKEKDLSESIDEFILKGLEGSELLADFQDQKNRELMVKGVKLNPREVKRFINNIILTKSVFDKPTDELIVVQALSFHRDWDKFLDLITPDEIRVKLLTDYKNLNQDGALSADLRNIQTEFYRQPDKIATATFQLLIKSYPSLKDVFDIYPLFFNHGNELRSFLDAGALEKLLQITSMEEYRRALDTTQVKTTQAQTSSNFFADYYKREDQGSNFAWTNIVKSEDEWRNKFSKDTILSIYEIFSFEKEYLPNVHSWLSYIKSKKDPDFDLVNELSTNLDKQLGELKKELSYEGTVDEEKKKLILNMQKQVADTITKIGQRLPP
jgi:hypothetical protein